MREVGEFEAKNKLRQLLDLLEQGEKVTITRHGKGVARQSDPCVAASKPSPLINEFVNGRRRANSAALTGWNGRPTGTKVARESNAL